MEHFGSKRGVETARALADYCPKASAKLKMARSNGIGMRALFTRPQDTTMATKPTDFSRASEDAKKQAGKVAGAVAEAAQDVYGQARESAADVTDTANTAARKTMGSLEKAIRGTIETQPYTAVLIALGIGWLLGRMHRPL
jgi:ElaB/YqjD/DUF883 family membrane-anchored ribosome-binding protein